MEELLQDINESINLFKEKRMKKVWKSDTQLKILMEQERDAEKKYNELSLDEDTRMAIDEWISCINKLDDYYEQVVYLQGLKDGLYLTNLRKKNDD